MTRPQHTATFEVEVDGNALGPVAQRLLIAAVVDDSIHQPDRFELVFRDPERTVLAEAGLTIGAEVRIAAVSDATDGPEALLTGEVTAVEAAYDGTGTSTAVRGYDHSHRLHRGRRTRTFEDASHEDIVRQIAAEADLEVGTIDPAPPPEPYVSQLNITDWRLLRRLAAEIGYEVAVREGTLEFRAPTDSADGPSPGDLEAGEPLQLSLGSNLVRFRTTVTSAQQVSEVEVRGWDVQQKRTLVGTSPAATNSVSLPVDPGELADRFGGGRYVSGDVPYRSQQEVDAAAEALAEHLSSAFAECDGVATGDPAIRAGTAISLGMVGEPFDGRYVVTSARHVLDADGRYTTGFSVSGRQERTLLGLMSGADRGRDRQIGVAVGVVTDIRDPEARGRVRLQLPWLSDDYVTDWARVAHPEAGDQRGVMSGPEVGDEVLVAFEQGDVRRPYVVGGLYNGRDLPFPAGADPVDQQSGDVNLRFWRTRRGHSLLFVDQRGEEGVALRTGDGGHQIELDQADDVVRIATGGQLVIEAQQDVTVVAQGEAEVSSGGDLTVTAGGQLELSGQAGVKIDSSGVVELNGSLIKLN